MRLFKKICSIAQGLRLLHILLETGGKLNVRKPSKLKFYVQDDCCIKARNNVFWNSPDYNTTMSTTRKVVERSS